MTPISIHSTLLALILFTALVYCPWLWKVDHRYLNTPCSSLLRLSYLHTCILSCFHWLSFLFSPQHASTCMWHVDLGHFFGMFYGPRSAFVFTFCNTPLLPRVPQELKRRHQARARVKTRRREYKSPVPSVIIGNVRSLTNKMELIKHQRQYWEAAYYAWRHGCTQCHRLCHLAFSLLGPTERPRWAVRGKVEGLQCLLMKGGVFQDMLLWRNISPHLTLNF